MPGAAWVPLPLFSTVKMRAHNIVCIHTMVGSLMGTDGYFRGLTNGTNSHYGTGGAGEDVRQWGDTQFQSGANYLGNGDVISIENADMGPGFPSWNINDSSAVPEFTASQCDDIANILAWECSLEAHKNCPTSWDCHNYGIPLELIPDSKPGRRGVGYHKLGVPGYVVPGGVLWSTKQGKVCPADPRVKQIPFIITLAKGKMAGGTSTTSEEDPLLTSVQPGKTELIPVPVAPTGKKVFARFGCDEGPAGGANIRVAAGVGQSKWDALKELNKVDGYTGWIFNGLANEWDVTGKNVLSVGNQGKNPLGVLLQIR